MYFADGRDKQKQQQIEHEGEAETEHLSLSCGLLFYSIAGIIFSREMKYISNGHKESYTLVARKRYMKKLLYVLIPSTYVRMYVLCALRI